MAMNASDGAAHGILASGVEVTFPEGSVLELRTGARPADAHQVATGTLLVAIAAPADPWGAPASRKVSKNGTWSDDGVDAGDIGWARLKQAGDAGTLNTTDERCDFTVTAVGGGGDIEVDNVNVAVDQPVTVTDLFIGA